MSLRPRTAWLYALFFLSGSAGLGYQMTWARLLAAGLGHELPAVLAVVGAFLGGLAAGSWLLDRRVSLSPNPGRWYALLEFVIGLWGLLSVAVIGLVNEAAPHLIGLEPSAVRHWAVAFALPALALLPATAAMGATLPAMERFVSAVSGDGRWVGGVYAANTLGAVAGILATAFFIVPAWGFRTAVGLLAAINLFCAFSALAGVWWLCRANGRRRLPEGEQKQQGAGAGRTAVAMGAGSTFPPHPGPLPLGGGEGERGGAAREIEKPSAVSSPACLESRAGTVSPTRLRATVLMTGWLGIGYEVAGVRALAQTLENTVYTFAAVLAVYLLGTGTGAALYQRWSGRRQPQRLLADLLAGLSLACVLGALVLPRVESVYEACRNAWGDGRFAVPAAEMTVAALVFGLPTLLMGATFSHLVQSARRKDGGVGRAAALNTLGGALAPAMFGVLLLPLLGLKWTFGVIALGYVALVPRFTGWRWAYVTAAMVGVGLLPAQLHRGSVPPGGRLVAYREGVMASVAVVENAAGERTLRVNNRFQMGGTAAAHAEYRQAHVPLLLHPAPARALFLGVGTGITLGAATLYPGLQSEGVELLPEVAALMNHFEPHNLGAQRHPHAALHVADARRFVRMARGTYDVIVADLFHPARDGAGALYTREHFEAIRGRLAPGGRFCQWLPLHQMDEPLVRAIVRTFLTVFPDAQAWLLHLNVDTPVIGLVAGQETARAPGAGLPARLGEPQLGAQLRQLALTDSIRLLGLFVAGPEELRSFAGGGPLNTDDRPLVTFGAPAFAYQKRVAPYRTFFALLDHGTGRPAFADPRVAAYLAARNVYLRGLVEEAEGRLPGAIDAFVESARLSEDFTSGYAQCLSLASVQARTQPEAARALLQRLVEAQPGRPVARELLQRLFP